MFQIGVVNIRNVGARTATQSYVTFEMQSLIDGERRLVIDVVAEGHLADTWQAIAGPTFSPVQSSAPLQKGLLKETVFVLFVEQEPQESLPRVSAPSEARHRSCAFVDNPIRLQRVQRFALPRLRRPSGGGEGVLASTPPEIYQNRNAALS